MKQRGIEEFAENQQGFTFTAVKAPIESVAAVLKERKDIVLAYTESVAPVKKNKKSKKGGYASFTPTAGQRDCFLIQPGGSAWSVLVQTVHWSELADLVMATHLAGSLSAALKTQAVAVNDHDSSGSSLLLCDKGRKKKSMSTEEDDPDDFYEFFGKQGIHLGRCFIESDDAGGARLTVDDPKSLGRVDHVLLAMPSEAEAEAGLGGGADDECEDEDEDDEGGSGSARGKKEDELKAAERIIRTMAKGDREGAKKTAPAAKATAPNVKKKVLLSKAEGKALFRQIEKGDARAVKAWMKSAQEVDARGEFDWTPFLWAVRYQQAKLAELLLDAGADLNATTAKRGTDSRFLAVNALMIAIINRDAKIQGLLQKRGIDLKYTDPNGWNVLVYALVYTDGDLATRLLDLGLRIPEKDYEHAMRFAIPRGGDDLVKTMINAHPGIESCEHILAYAAKRGRLELVRFLLAAGFDVNALVDTEDGTALKCAAREGHVEVVKCLLEQGADPDKVTKRGDTPLAWAKRCKHYRVITVLKKATK